MSRVYREFAERNAMSAPPELTHQDTNEQHRRELVPDVKACRACLELCAASQLVVHVE